MSWQSDGLLAATSWRIVESHLGVVAVGGDDVVVTQVLLPHEVVGPLPTGSGSPLVATAAIELAEFLGGERTRFDVPIASAGTPFQEAVWDALDLIPYGETRTYQWVAAVVGRPRAPRAVGQALGRNPIPLLRPCHRVVAASGIGGYGGGPLLKAALLALESSSR